MDRYTSQSLAPLYKARLSVLLDNINSLYSSGTSASEDTLSSMYANAMFLFTRSMDGSILETMSNIYSGASADPMQYNMIMSSILDSLSILYSESYALDKMVASNFNSILCRKDQISQISKRISDKLGTYLLFVDPDLGAGYFFGDTFNSLENIDSSSVLLDKDECYVGLDEGAILLPLDGDPVRPKIKSYTINSTSNGTPGNNHELNKTGHSIIETIGDGETNTWFEYEKVSVYESDVPLILDITITLDAISIINYINISPINFGSPTPVKIQTLDTSVNGIDFVSIKDEIPIKDFVSIDEDNTFSLCPSSSKFSGQGAYSFLPRRTKFIHIIFEQNTPYSISTINGDRLRYAIGIRDIDVVSRKFKSEGSIISKSFSSNAPIRKVSIFANENPIDYSMLADISHFISEDNGGTWRQIQPTARSDNSISEVIEFNTISPDSINTADDILSLRHKIYMKRDPDAFVGDVVTKVEKLSKTEILPMPLGGDFSFTLSEEPISESVGIVLPFYGSYSCPRSSSGSAVQGKPRMMDLDMFEFVVDGAVSTADSSTDVLRFDLPYIGFENIQEHLRVFYEGSQIEYCPKDAGALGQTDGILSSTSYDEVDSNSKVYFLDRNGRQLQFGYVDSTGTRCGFIPPGGSKIQICLDGDNPRIELTDSGYILMLTNCSDGIKENMSIVSMSQFSDSEASDYIISVPPGRDKHKIPSRRSGVLSGKRMQYISPIGASKISQRKSNDKVIQAASVVENSLVVESQDGLIPPSFVDDSSTWEMIEYSYADTRITGSSRQYTDAVEYIDGRQELLEWDATSNSWIMNEHAFSFDSITGNLYLGSPAPSDRKVYFKCKLISHNLIPIDRWAFYKDNITGKTDPSKIILDPRAVYTHTNKRSIDSIRSESGVASGSEISVLRLLSSQSKQHDWFKQRLVKGTVSFDSSIFLSGAKPTEVQYVDGNIELSNVVQVIDERISLSSIGSNLYTYTLYNTNSNRQLIGMPSFAAIRSITSALPPNNLFISHVDTTPVTHGQWTYVISSDGICTITIYLDDGVDYTAEHVVSYQYKALDSGIDTSGLYSIDYTTATIHFASPITLDGYVQFETSLYSAFYNLGEFISDDKIDSIEAESKKITLSESYGTKLLKLSTVLKSRPEYAKIIYDFYKKTTESIKDLEPYFSPICKDIAFRAVTSDMLGDL